MTELVLTDTVHGARLQVRGTTAPLADLYLWLHYNPEFNNPVTIGPVVDRDWDRTWEESGRGSL